MGCGMECGGRIPSPFQLISTRFRTIFSRFTLFSLVFYSNSSLTKKSHPIESQICPKTSNMESIPSRVILHEISEKDDDKYCVIVDDNLEKNTKVSRKNREVIEICAEQDDEDCCVVLENDNDNVVKKLTQCLDVLYISSGEDDDDDDYCVILECDPDNPVKVVTNDSEENVGDELLVVAEKGQVACRDYPHARHLCSKYPWSTDPHKKYCDLCHCFVCDIRAPCAQWGSGSSCDDHCHANDKEEKWRMQRRSLQIKSLQSN